MSSLIDGHRDSAMSTIVSQISGSSHGRIPIRSAFRHGRSVSDSGVGVSALKNEEFIAWL